MGKSSQKKQMTKKDRAEKKKKKKKKKLKLSFQDLTLDAGPAKVKMNGSIVLDVLYAEDAK